jgi:hypothetical protein
VLFYFRQRLLLHFIFYCIKDWSLLLPSRPQLRQRPPQARPLPPPPPPPPNPARRPRRVGQLRRRRGPTPAPPPGGRPTATGTPTVVGQPATARLGTVGSRRSPRHSGSSRAAASPAAAGPAAQGNRVSLSQVAHRNARPLDAGRLADGPGTGPT